METFYKDKKKTFECKVLVEGARIEDTSARLVLKFPKSNMNLLYYGTINEDSTCSIEIPALKEIKDNEGEAILEVISESTFFEAWKSDIELKQSKTVKVEMIQKKEDKPLLTEKPKITIEKKEEIKSVPIKKESGVSNKLISLYKESKTRKNSLPLKNYFPSIEAKEIYQSLKKYLDLNESKRFMFFLDKLSADKLNQIKKRL